MTRRPLAVVVPVYGDWQPLLRLLEDLGPLTALSVVVSVDPPPEPLPEGVRHLAAAIPGRGEQLAQGIDAVAAEWYWMVHADSRIRAECVAQLEAVVQRERPAWGRFDVRLEPGRPSLKLVAFFMNLRSRLTGICTGDQGIFVHYSLLTAAGGMPRQPLMEDIELSSRLRRLTRPVILPGPLRTSARRWNRDGVLRTILRMWGFRLRYWMGACPSRLARAYYHRPAEPRQPLPDADRSPETGPETTSAPGPEAGQQPPQGAATDRTR